MKTKDLRNELHKKESSVSSDAALDIDIDRVKERVACQLDFPPFVTLSGSSPVLLCLHLCCIISLPYPLHKLCFLKHLLFSTSRFQPF